MDSSFLRILDNFIAKAIGSKSFAHAVVFFISFALITALGYAIYWMLNKYLIPFHKQQIKKQNPSNWTRVLLKYNIIEKVYWFIPVMFVYFAVQVLSDEKIIFSDQIIANIEKFITVLIIIIATILACAWLNVLNDMYKNSLIMSQGMSIQGYIELTKIVSWIIGLILIISALLNVELVKIFAGLGALSAVLLLIFKDSLLGLVSNIQLSAYDIIRIGDWIEMSEYHLNGIVLNITLSTVQVQNFDKSVMTVPTSDLLLKGVTNWRAMREAKGRRVRKSLYIDINTITFCTERILERVEQLDLMHNIIKNMRSDAVTSNKLQTTNIALYRKYIVAYLNTFIDIHKENFPLVVHYLQPTELGLPIELYFFTSRLDFADYEAIQTEIIDHLIAILPLFSLRHFQQITQELQNSKNDNTIYI